MTLLDVRRAALTLHALPAADREWVLCRLDPGQQRLLGDQLRELQALGVVADDRLVKEALMQAAGEEAASPAKELLRSVDAECVHGLVQNEPAALVARLLALGPWPWEADLMQRFGSTRRSQVLARRMSVQRCASLDDNLLSELARRIGGATPKQRASGDAAAPPQPRPWLRRMRTQR
jgi:hypothetical protein